MYDVPFDRVETVSRGLGLPTESLCFNQGAVDVNIAIQGEYLNDVVVLGSVAFGGVFVYSRAKLKMRDALRVGCKTTYGLQARCFLREAMTPSSWADFEVLLEQYPGHVLEVSVYEETVGDLVGRNAVVWEVRKY